jgi:hypothetical protein
MTSRRLLVLVVAAIAALAAGLWLASRQSAPGSAGKRTTLYPMLDSGVHQVQAVRIFKAGDARAVELKRGAIGWTVSERGDYRADQAKLSKLVRDIADATIIEEKTGDPERYAALGVEDTSRTDAKGIRIVLMGAVDPLANLIVGHPGAGGNSRYVRRAGEKRSWLVDRSLEAPVEPDAWLDKSIADIAADRVQSVTVTVNGEKAYTVAKASRSDASFAVEKLPKGKQLRSPTIADGFATALTGFALSGVQAAGEFTEPPPDRATVRTFDGLVVDLRGWKREGKRFVAIEASFDSQQAKRFASAATGAPANPSAPDVGKEAVLLAQKSAGHVYEVPSYRYDSLFKPLKDLL